MELKYKLTDETIIFKGITLYRIEALKDFSDVKKGDKGGFVESEKNLSQDGTCWVYDTAKIHGNAVIFGNATVYGDAEVRGFVNIYDNAKVYGNSEIYDHAEIHGSAQVFGRAKIYGYAEICGGSSVSGNANIYCHIIIRGYAIIKNDSDYIIFKNFWSSRRFFVWTRSNNMWSVGCFYGTGKELIEKAYKDSELSGREYKRVVNYVEAILKEN